MKKKLTKNEFYVFWQCPICNSANIEITDDFLLKIRKFECNKCNKKYNLQKKVIQILCQPIIESF